MANYNLYTTQEAVNRMAQDGITVSGGTGASALQTQGTAADNAPAVGNPVRIGGKYNATLPTYADGDAADLQVNNRGILLALDSLGTAAVVTGVAASVTVVTLKTANSNRKELTIKNSPASSGILYFKYGSGAAISSGNYTDSLLPGESAYINKFDGEVTGIWDSAGTGFANVTEVS